MSTTVARWWTNSSTIIVARAVQRKTAPQRAPRMLPDHITISVQLPLISRPRTIDNRIQIFNSWIRSRLASFLPAYPNHTWLLQVTHRRQSKGRPVNLLASRQEWQIRQPWTRTTSRIYGSSTHCSNNSNNNSIISSNNSRFRQEANTQATISTTSLWLNLSKVNTKALQSLVLQ